MEITEGYDLRRDRLCATLSRVANGPVVDFTLQGYHPCTNIYGVKHDTECFVCNSVDETDNNTYLVFRGTEVGRDFSWKDIRTNLKIEREDYLGWFKLHKGFLDAWKEIREEVVREIWKKKTSKGMLIITGHSLGGALACLAAYDLRHFKPYVVTFGQPKVGGKPFAKWLDTQDYRRYVHRGDIIARVPFWLGYRHSRNLVYISESNIEYAPSFWFIFSDSYKRFFRRFADHNIMKYIGRIYREFYDRRKS